ncbi:MAG: hypothetical protein O7C75_21925 [Verrucomicrobia bacterium]|nr:hypothetical protein [Verrucomicrobiota bacterium]
MTNNLPVKTATLLALLVVTGVVQARVVISKAKQNDFLQTARVLLSSPSESSKQLDSSYNDPFHRVVEEAPVEEVEEEAPVVETARELTDSEILVLVAQKLKPSGFIDQGGQQYLILNGKKVQDGVLFNFPHQDKRYSIEINQIKSSSFTLHLNSESKTISME